MKAFLMYRDHDFDLEQNFPSNEQALTQDLELNTLFNAMALGDKFLFDSGKKGCFVQFNTIWTQYYIAKIFLGIA